MAENKKQNIQKELYRLLGEDGYMVFACFHDNMFVFEQKIDEGTIVELDFFLSENGSLNSWMDLGDLFTEIDWTKYVNVSVKIEGGLDEINLNDLGE